MEHRPKKIWKACGRYLGSDMKWFDQPTVSCWAASDSLKRWGIEWKVVKDLVYLQFVYRSKAITPCMFTDVIEIRVLEDAVVLLIREGRVISEEKLFGLRLDPRMVDDEIMPSSRQFGFHFDGDENVTALDVVTAYGELLDARLQSLRDLETRRPAIAEPRATPPKRIAAPKRKGKEKEPTDNYDTLPLEELVMKQKRGGTSEKDLDELNSRIKQIFTPVYPFGNAPLETRARIRVKVQADKLQLAPPDIVYRGIVDQRKEQLLKEFKSMSFTRLRVPIVVLPIVGDEESAQTIYPSKPRFPEDIMNGSFWIIGGQHSVVAAREAVQYFDLKGGNRITPSQRKSLLEHEIVVVWSLDKAVLMALSKVLNKKSEERDAKSTVQSQILRARQNWHLQGCPMPSLYGAKHDARWNVSPHFFFANSLC